MLGTEKIPKYTDVSFLIEIDYFFIIQKKKTKNNNNKNSINNPVEHL